MASKLIPLIPSLKQPTVSADGTHVIPALNAAKNGIVNLPSAGLGAFYPVLLGPTSLTIALAHNGKLIDSLAVTPVTLTIDPDATLDLPLGFRFRALREGGGTGNITIVGGAGVTINGTVATVAQYDMLECFKVDANLWVSKLS